MNGISDDELQQPVTFSRRTALSSIFASVVATVAIPSAEAEPHAPLVSASNPQAMRQALRTTKPLSRTQHTATALTNGLVVVSGGIMNLPNKKELILNRVQIYDLTGDFWMEAAPMLVPRARHSALALPNGKLVVMGGYHNMALNSTEVYDPMTNTWEFGVPMPTHRQGHTAVLAGDYIVVTGGVSTSALQHVDIYHLGTNLWMPH